MAFVDVYPADTGDKVGFIHTASKSWYMPLKFEELLRRDDKMLVCAGVYAFPYSVIGACVLVDGNRFDAVLFKFVNLYVLASVK